MPAADVTRWTIREAGAALRRGDLSAEELTEAVLARIAERNPVLNAYITVTADTAREAARQADVELRAGRDRGPLHGIPVGVKDLFDTAGIRTTAGMSFFADRVPKQDATAVARLRAAGAVLTGKHNTHEAAFGTTTMNPHFGPVRNPHDPSRIPGGSSGGSAVAVADGMCFGALGTDTGGSVRGPASLCGIAGLKPTYGRISRAGVVPLAWTLDHVGPLGRTAEDVALLLNAIVGPDPRDPTAADVPVPDFTAGLGQGVAGLRLALLRAPQMERAEPEVRAAVEAAAKALAGAGAVLTEVEAPLLEEAEWISQAIMGPEAAAYHLERLRTRPEGFGADVRDRLEVGAAQPAVEYVNAQRARTALTEQVNAWFARVDAVLLPGTARTAPEIGPDASAAMRAYPSPRRPFNLTGHPAISVPCGVDSAGLPIGLQIVGRHWDEATVLRVAAAWERLAGARPAAATSIGPAGRNGAA
jgi:aspartyl-tRNA(Asn)/glutamyl-tRNA(Gln) amidotransferase subunit A